MPTTIFNKNENSKEILEKTLKETYEALKEKGYNPTNQLVGYLLSGDPTYITSHKGARIAISRFERDELLKTLITTFINLS